MGVDPAPTTTRLVGSACHDAHDGVLTEHHGGKCKRVGRSSPRGYIRQMNVCQPGAVHRRAGETGDPTFGRRNPASLIESLRQRCLGTYQTVHFERYLLRVACSLTTSSNAHPSHARLGPFHDHRR